MIEKFKKMSTKEKLLWIIAGFAILVGILVVFRVVSGEDTWVCKDGQWQKHGNPREEMPLEECK